MMERAPTSLMDRKERVALLSLSLFFFCNLFEQFSDFSRLVHRDGRVEASRSEAKISANGKRIMRRVIKTSARFRVHLAECEGNADLAG